MKGGIWLPGITSYLPNPSLLILRFKTFDAPIMRTSLFTEKVHHLSSMAHGVQGCRYGTRHSGADCFRIQLTLYSNNLLHGGQWQDGS